MELGYTILYVRDVDAAVEFYERAFELEREFVGEEGGYAQMKTGSTALGFASIEQIGAKLPGGLRPADPDEPPPGVEIAFTTDDVDAAYERATQAGARAVSPPAEKPWGQIVAYVRDLDGYLVEICTPM